MRVDFRARHTATSIHCGIPTVAVHSDVYGHLSESMGLYSVKVSYYMVAIHLQMLI